MRRDLFGGNSLDYVDRLMAVTVADAVRGEVHSIQSKDLAGVQGFSGRDHRGVRQIHGMIRVSFHQYHIAEGALRNAIHLLGCGQREENARC
jgi:hypothetical protein